MLRRPGSLCQSRLVSFPPSPVTAAAKLPVLTGFVCAGRKNCALIVMWSIIVSMFDRIRTAGLVQAAVRFLFFRELIFRKTLAHLLTGGQSRVMTSPLSSIDFQILDIIKPYINIMIHNFTPSTAMPMTRRRTEKTADFA